MKKKISFVLCLICTLSLNAQDIKVASKDYIESTLTSNSVKELTIDELFIQYDGTTRNGILSTYCIGDTVLIMNCKDEVIGINHVDKSIKKDTITNGTYIIDELYLFKDGKEKILQNIRNLQDDGYVSERIFLGSTMDRLSLEEYKKESQNINYKTGLPLEKMYRLVAEDGSREYYIRILPYKIMPKKYFAYMCDNFLNKKFYILNARGNSADILYRDDLTGNRVELHDESYLCKDVVVNPNTMDVSIVFEGEKSGTFAAGMEQESSIYECLVYKYGTETSLFKRGSANYSLRLYDVPVWKNNARDAFVCSDVIDRYISYEKKKIDSEQAAKELDKKNREKRIAQMIGLYGSAFGNAIVNRRVELDMTQDMVKEALGYPRRKYNIRDNSGTYNVWLFNINTEIYFFNGKVIRIVNN